MYSPNENGQKNLYHVDSQSSGPRRISSRLATRRCLANAYAWEPFVVKAKTSVCTAQQRTRCTRTARCQPIERATERETSEEFLQAWRSSINNRPNWLNLTRTICEPKQMNMHTKTINFWFSSANATAFVDRDNRTCGPSFIKITQFFSRPFLPTILAYSMVALQGN